MNNKFNQVVALTVFTAFSHMSSAEDYTSEFSARYSTGDIDGKGNTGNVDEFGISQQVFFSEVDTTVGPLAKAAFISRASSYTLGYSVDNYDGLQNTVLNGEVDKTNAAIDWRGNDMGFTLGLDYSFTDKTSFGAFEDVLEASVGFYVAETTEISVQYSRKKYKQFESDEKTVALSISHVGTGDFGFAIDGSISMAESISPRDPNVFSVYQVLSTDDTSKDDEQFGIAVSAAVYPTRDFGMGAGFDVSLAEEDSDRVFAFTEWFFKPNMKVAATYYISDKNDVDTNGFIIDLSYRLKQLVMQDC